jgi:hypothetical protein
LYAKQKRARPLRSANLRRAPVVSGLSPHWKNLYIISSLLRDGVMTTARIAIEILIAAGVLIVLWRVFFRRS